MRQLYLVNDINGVVQLLALEEGVQVVEQEFKVVLSVSVRDDDGCAVPGLTVRRPVASTPHHKWVFPLDLCQSEP